MKYGYKWDTFLPGSFTLILEKRKTNRELRVSSSKKQKKKE